jgi:hypothetical protein
VQKLLIRCLRSEAQLSKVLFLSNTQNLSILAEIQRIMFSSAINFLEIKMPAWVITLFPPKAWT